MSGGRANVTFFKEKIITKNIQTTTVTANQFERKLDSS